MKWIKKFEIIRESKDSEFEQMVVDSFSDLIDEEFAEIIELDDKFIGKVGISIYLNDPTESSDIKEFIKVENSRNDVLRSVYNSIKKLESLTDDNLFVEYEYFDNELVLYFEMGSGKFGDFYKISPSGLVSIDKEVLKKYIDLKYQYDLKFSSINDDGDKSHIISIKTSGSIIDNNYESIVENLESLYIGDKPLLKSKVIRWESSKPIKYYVSSTPGRDIRSQDRYEKTLALILNDDISWAWD